MRQIHRVGFGLVLSAIVFMSAACGGGSSTNTADTAANTSFSSRGIASAGEDVFQSHCVACHTTNTDTLVGPGLAGLFSGEGPTLPNGVDYRGNLSNGNSRTETNVAAWIKSGGQGQIGVMPPQALDDQQLADVIAYLRTLHT